MLSIKNIPDEVLELVIHGLLWSKGNSLERFKYGLFYLAICSRWRRLGKPLVFRQAFVMYDETKIEREEMDVYWAETRSPQTGEAKVNNTQLVTNLNLAQAVGCMAAIRHINITILFLDNPYSGLAKVVELLGNASVLNRISRLSMCISPMEHIRDYSSSDSDSEDNPKMELAYISNNIVKCLPNIKHLTIQNSLYDISAQYLFGHIAEHYAGQLEELYCHIPIRVIKPCVFTQLKCATLEIENSSDIIISKQCAENLKVLHIFGKFKMHPLDHLAMFDSSTDIELSNLQELRIGYFNDASMAAHVSNADSSSSNLVLPKLSKLVVHDPTSNYNQHVLSRMALPNYINSIDICASNSIYEAISHRPLPAANKVKLSTQLLETNPTVFYNINQALNRFAHCKSATINIGCLGFPINEDFMTSTALTNLRIDSPVSSSTLISLLGKLPNLTYLAVVRVSLNYLTEPIGMPDINCYDQHPMVPFNSNLTNIKIMCRQPEQYYDLLSSVVLYVLLKLQKLQKLRAMQVLKYPFLAQLDQYKPLYPHLNNVDLRLNCSEL